MDILEFFKVVLFGIVEGITEWLPISSTGHIVLLEQFVKLDVSPEFSTMFNILIQLGAILAVIVIYIKKLWPFSTKEKYYCKKDTWTLWFKIVVACIPGICMIPFDDFVTEHLHKPGVIAATLIIYGIIFIVIEKSSFIKKAKINSLADITFQMAFFIGVFQVLAMIPGTSRSGATIIGALLLGISRYAAAEFTFFLAIPVMIGSSFLKLIKFGFAFTTTEALVLAVGMLTSFIVSVIAIKFLMGYIKKHNFVVFGWYRIVLGCLVAGYFLIAK